MFLNYKIDFQKKLYNKFLDLYNHILEGFQILLPLHIEHNIQRVIDYNNREIYYY